MAKTKTSRKTEGKSYRCMIGFTFWKGKRIVMGQVITVTDVEMKNKGLKAKLKRAFQPVGSVNVVSEPVQMIDKGKE